MESRILTLLNTLKIKLQGKLPGEKSHEKFLPEIRKKKSIYSFDKINYRESAVMIVLFIENNRLFSLLIKRNDYNGHHSGQIGLPGGKTEDKDIDLISTAIRETYEEIGIKVSNSNIIGSLSPISIPISKFKVYPYICFLNKKPEFLIDKNEVKDLIIYELSNLFIESNTKISKVQAVNQIIDAPSFIINNEIVWGATSMILNEFKEIIEDIIFENKAFTNIFTEY